MQIRRVNWWHFGENVRRSSRRALTRFALYCDSRNDQSIASFNFLYSRLCRDNMLMRIASDDAFHLGVLSSRIHVTWALRAGGWLGVGNDPRYSKSTLL